MRIAFRIFSDLHARMNTIVRKWQVAVVGIKFNNLNVSRIFSLFFDVEDLISLGVFIKIYKGMYVPTYLLITSYTVAILYSVQFAYLRNFYCKVEEFKRINSI